MNSSGNEQPNLVMFRIGNTVAPLPRFHAIARTFPRHQRILLADTVDSTHQSSAESVLENRGLVHETLCSRSRQSRLE